VKKATLTIYAYARALQYTGCGCIHICLYIIYFLHCNYAQLLSMYIILSSSTCTFTISLYIILIVSNALSRRLLFSFFPSSSPSFAASSSSTKTSIFTRCSLAISAMFITLVSPSLSDDDVDEDASPSFISFRLFVSVALIKTTFSCLSTQPKVPSNVRPSVTSTRTRLPEEEEELCCSWINFRTYSFDRAGSNALIASSSSFLPCASFDDDDDDEEEEVIFFFSVLSLLCVFCAEFFPFFSS